MGTCSCKNLKYHNFKGNEINFVKIKNEIAFRCTYETKDFNEIQILNFRGKVEINEEIHTKIKILNNNKKEDLVFTKKFNKIGLNTIDFVIEGKITNASFLFNYCSY